VIRETIEKRLAYGILVHVASDFMERLDLNALRRVLEYVV